MQQGILISQTRNPNTYKNIFRFSVTSSRPGPIDVSRLQTAWQKVVARHSTLRTVFVNSLSGDGLYDQIVLKSWFPKMLSFDCIEEEAHDSLSGLSPAIYGQT